MEERNVGLAFVTETWLGGGNKLDEDWLRETAGVEYIARNRTAPASNGVFYGGIAVLWKRSEFTFKRVDRPNFDDLEIMVVASSIAGHSRKIVAVICLSLIHI